MNSSSDLPKFEELLRYARKQLGDIEETLRLPWRGANPTTEQVDALEEVRELIAMAMKQLETVGLIERADSVSDV